ncbi:unnamed protein product [Lampetra fluviatilis]
MEFGAASLNRSAGSHEQGPPIASRRVAFAVKGNSLQTHQLDTFDNNTAWPCKEQKCKAGADSLCDGNASPARRPVYTATWSNARLGLGKVSEEDCKVGHGMNVNKTRVTLSNEFAQQVETSVGGTQLEPSGAKGPGRDQDDVNGDGMRSVTHARTPAILRRNQRERSLPARKLL